MRLTQFQYDLPPERIAQHPTDRREDARLLQLSRQNGAIDTSATIAALADHARPGDCWVVNDTRVRPARLLTRKPTGGRVELLVLSARGSLGEAMYRSSKPLKAGQVLHCDATDEPVTVTEALGGGLVSIDLGDDADALLGRAGKVPLPPYIAREPDARDHERYQTVYADTPGAVAAPTAGLHFSEPLMAAMTERGATFARITLHVGPGTFRPIRAEDIRDHELHAETYAVSSASAAKINAAERIVAVGTTCVRTLETIATDGPERVRPGAGETRIYITPGHTFRAVDALLTNFHLPGSSLLVLVAAFAGLDPTLAAYSAALAQDFRFYSYGDAMFIS